MTDAMMQKSEELNKKINEMFDDIKGMMNPANWTKAKLCGMISSAGFVTFFVVLTIMLATYGFGNPDPNSCWVVKGMDSAATTRTAMEERAETLGKVVPEGYPIEMHSVYVTWALWGFWTNFLFAGIFVASMLLMAFNTIPMAAMFTSTLASLGWIVSTVLWLILGMVWRYSQAGMTAAGDRLEKSSSQTNDEWTKALAAASISGGYQLKTGKFLGFVASLFGALILISLVFAAVIGFGMCCCGIKEMPDLSTTGDKANYSQLPTNENGEEDDAEQAQQPSGDIPIEETKA